MTTFQSSINDSSRTNMRIEQSVFDFGNHSKWQTIFSLSLFNNSFNTESIKTLQDFFNQTKIKNILKHLNIYPNFLNMKYLIITYYFYNEMKKGKTKQDIKKILDAFNNKNKKNMISLPRFITYFRLITLFNEEINMNDINPQIPSLLSMESKSDKNKESNDSESESESDLDFS